MNVGKYQLTTHITMHVVLEISSGFLRYVSSIYVNTSIINVGRKVIITIICIQSVVRLSKKLIIEKTQKSNRSQEENKNTPNLLINKK